MLWIVAAWMLHSGVWAQDYFSFRALSVNDGLPQGFVSGIAQDKLGFIWISTHNGLARYDGRKFKLFQSTAGDTASLSSNVINNIFYDGSNRLWIFYFDGAVDQLDPVTEKLIHLSEQQEYHSLKGLSSIHQCFYEDSRHHFLMSTKNGVIAINNSGKPRLTVFLSDRETGNFRVKAITENNEGHLFFITEKEIIETDEKGKVLQRADFTGSDAVVFNDNIAAGGLQEYALGARFKGSDSLYIGGKKGMLLYLKNSRRLFFVKGLSPDARTVWRNNLNPSCFFYYNKEGLYCYSLSENRYLKVGSYAWEAGKVVPYMLFLDRTGMIWCGTNGDGIFLKALHAGSFAYEPLRKSFQETILRHYLDLRDIPESVTGFATKDLRWTYNKKDTICFLNRYKRFLHTLQLHFVYKDKYTVKTWKLPFPDSIGISTVDFDQQGNLWAIDDSRRLLKLDMDSPSVQIVGSGITTHPSHDISHVCFDEDGSFWIASTMGLYHYAPYHDMAEAFRKSGKSGGLNSELLMSIVQDDFDKNFLWIGSLDAGLIRMDKRNRKFTTFSTQNGIPDNSIYGIQKDRNGYLWCSTNKGIFRFNTLDYSVRRFYDINGFPEQEFNRFHDLQLPDGRIAFAGSSYYTVFNPADFADDTLSPAIAITEVSINNYAADYKDRYALFNQPLNSLSAIRLNYDQNFIRISFAALQYDQPQHTEYRYMLEGLDDDWVYAGNNNTAQYTHLAPGSYKLSLNATNASGKWSSSVKTLNITIRPPWWQTWWAYSCYLLAASSLAWWLLRLRLKRMQLHQEMILKEKETQRIKEVEEIKDKFFSNITHELRTPLSLIISPADHYLRHPEEFKDHEGFLRAVRRNASQLLRLINQLLDMSKIESGNMKLALTGAYFSDYIRKLVAGFEPLAAQKHIKLRFESDHDESYFFDPEKWERIMYNLLGNAIKFTSPNGVIIVSIKMSNGNMPVHEMELKVCDTGIGIAPHHIPHLFSRFYQADSSVTRGYQGTGIGLSLVKELVDLMDGSISVESEEGKGAAFIIKLRLHKAPEGARLEPKEKLELLPVITPENKTTATEEAPVLLIAEDNEELNAFITACLQPYYRVFSVPDGRQGWEMAVKELPDIIISDMMMPDMDGFEFCEKIKNDAATSHIAFILLTAKAAYESRISGLGKGADDYLTKPFYVEELLLRIRNILTARAALKQYLKQQLEPEAVLPQPEHVHDEFMSKLYSVIEEELTHSGFSVGDLAGKMNMSRSTLNRKLAAIIGMSANEIIRKYRLKKAAAVLRSGKSVSETAYLTGFESPSYFSTSFKEMYGIAPSEYAAGGNAAMASFPES